MDRSIEFNKRQYSSILAIFVTSDVSKFSKLIVFNEEHPKNNEPILVIDEEIKWVKSIDVIYSILLSPSLEKNFSILVARVLKWISNWVFSAIFKAELSGKVSPL